MKAGAKGVDLSEWNANVDYTILGKQVDFVILRDGYGTTKDKLFSTHAAGFKALKKPIECYHFLYGTNSAKIRENARSAIKFVQSAGLPKDTRIWCDLEYDTIDKAKAQGVELGKNEINLFVRTFCDEILSAGYQTGIYTNLDFISRYYTSETLAKYPTWLASYTKDCPIPCLMWQYSGSGKMEGCEGAIDLDMYRATDAVEIATRWMEDLARDDSHGYDQQYRWGERGDYDCSSAVITAWQEAGIPVKDCGATYTGNMYSAFKKAGFRDVTASVNLSTGAGLQRGDVLLNKKRHTAMYIGDGKEVEASVNEKGKATGGQPGDQTGKEILIRSYRNYPWDVVLRLSEDEPQPLTKEGYMFTVQTVKMGTRGADALLCQRLLREFGHSITADGICGKYTHGAIISFQSSHKLEADGICGQKTWARLLGV